MGAWQLSERIGRSLMIREKWTVYRPLVLLIVLPFGRLSMVFGAKLQGRRA